MNLKSNFMKYFNKYKEVVLYAFFGVVTTIVNFAIYFFLRWLNIPYEISNSIAIFTAILVAYITNKKYVFESNTQNAYETIKEFFKFFGCRMFSFVADMMLMIIFIDFVKTSEIVAKVITSVAVIILNYIFSKLLIFKN